MSVSNDLALCISTYPATFRPGIKSTGHVTSAIQCLAGLGHMIENCEVASAALRHLLVWLGCVLDGAQRLPFVLQFVVELTKFGGGVAGLLVDSFATFVAHLLAWVQTLSEWGTAPWSHRDTPPSETVAGTGYFLVTSSFFSMLLCDWLCCSSRLISRS